MARSVTATVPAASFASFLEDASAVEINVIAATTASTLTAAARPSVSSNLPSISRRADRMVNSLLLSASVWSASDVLRRVVVKRERPHAHLQPAHVLEGVEVERGGPHAYLPPAEVLQGVVVERGGPRRNLSLCRSVLRPASGIQLLSGGCA